MGAVGSVLGGILIMASAFLAFSVTWSYTQAYLPLLWFFVVGALGGYAIGSLNTKRKLKEGYRNEYITLGSMSIAFILLFGGYYFLFGVDKVSAKLVSTKSVTTQLVLLYAMASGILAWLGFALTRANWIADT